MRGQTQRLEVTGYFPKRPKLALDDFGPLPATFHLLGVIRIQGQTLQNFGRDEVPSSLIISLAGQSSPFVQMQMPNIVGSSFQACGKHEAQESSLQEGQPSSLRKKGLECSNGIIAPYRPGKWQSKKAVRLCRRLQAWRCR